MSYVKATHSIPVGRLLDEVKRVIDRADEQHRDLNAVEAVKVETLLEMAERYGRPTRLPLSTRGVIR